MQRERMNGQEQVVVVVARRHYTTAHPRARVTLCTSAAGNYDSSNRRQLPQLPASPSLSLSLSRPVHHRRRGKLPLLELTALAYTLAVFRGLRSYIIRGVKVFSSSARARVRTQL